MGNKLLFYYSVNNTYFISRVLSITINNESAQVLFRLIKDKTTDENGNLVEAVGKCCLQLTLAKTNLTEEDIALFDEIMIVLRFLKPRFLPTNNTNEYIPTEDYHPATKKYIDDSIKENGIVKPIEVFETENGFFGKTAYIDVDSMIPYTQYGLSEEYFDCPTIAFVVRTETKPYATVNLSIPSEVKNYMVTAKTTSNEVTSITLKSLNFDYKININNKATSSGVTTELIYNTNYLGTNNTREYTPTSDYHPATKKYVDDSLSNIEEYVTETELEEKGYLTEIPTEYITQKIPTPKARQ